MGTTVLLRKCKCGTKAYDVEDLELFVKAKTHKYGRANKCKKCHNYNAKQDILTPIRTKKATVKRDYGITLEEYDRCMFSSNVCEICGTKDNLCYDHCHITNDFRGVLCSSCNRHLGGLGNTIESINKVLAYLTKDKV